MQRLSFNTVLLFLTTLLFLVPGLPFWGLDGIPLTTTPEYIVCVILVLAWFVTLVGGQGTSVLNAEYLKKSKTKFVVLLLALCSLKAGLFYSSNLNSSESFQVCYKELKKNSDTCLFSAENIFRFSNATYLTPAVVWQGSGGQEQWHFNEDFRSNAPSTISITYNGVLNAESNAEFRILYQGKVSGKIADQTIDASSKTSSTVELLPIATGKEISLELSVLNGPDSYLEVQKKTSKGWETAYAGSPSNSEVLSIIFKTGAIVLSAMTYLLVAIFLWNLLSLLTLNPTWLFLPLGMLLAYYLPQSRLGLRFVLASVFLLSLYSKKKFPSIHPVQWVVFLATCLAVSHWHNLSGTSLIIRQPGDDPLSYDTIARYILRDRSLQGGEDVFFLQPGFRYYQSAMFAVFGERNIFPTYLNLLLLFTTLWGFFTWLETKIYASVSTRLISIFCLLMMAGAGTDLVMANLSEFVSWVSILIGIILGFSIFPTLVSPLKNVQITPQPLWYFVLFPALLAYAGIVRPNQIIGSITLFAVWFFLAVRIAVSGTKNPGLYSRILISVLAFGFVVFLPLAHNLYFGKSFVLLSSQSTYAPALIIPPGNLPNVLHAGGDQSKLFTQLRHLFVVGSLYVPLHLITRTLFNLLFVGFLIALVVRFRKSNFFLILVALMIPLSYLMVHVFYDATCYYPRHIIAPYLMFAFVGIWLLGQKISLTESNS